MTWIYDHNTDNSARYTLGPAGEDRLFCFGINPSTAAPGSLDNTVKSVERIAHRHGFDAFMMLNVYPQRATNPDDMHQELDPELHAQNLLHIDQYFTLNPTKKILAAWGTLIHKRPYLLPCLRDIYEVSRRHDCHWYRIGPFSKAGHPHHPLYLSNSEMMEEFDIEGYISNF